MVVGACTPDEPAPRPLPSPEASPTPTNAGLRVGVVTPPAGELDAGVLRTLRRDLDALATERSGEIARMRIVEPDDASFVEDVAALLADDGADLVCVLGRQAARAVASLADRYPATRFCGAPATIPDPPDNLDATTLATEQLGRVVGAGAAALTPDGGAVAIVASGERTRREAFVAGLRRSLRGTEVAVERAPGDDTEVRQAARAVRQAQVDVAVVDLPGWAAEGFVARLGARTPVLLVGPAVGRALEEPPALTWIPRWSVVVRAAVERALAPDAEVPTVLGFEADAFHLLLVDDVDERLRDALDRAVADLGDAGGGGEPSGPPAPDPR